jgi:replication factor C subunit 3/5
MFLYKYHPRTFDNLTYNLELKDILHNYSQYADEQCHILLNGILHSGKRTMAYCYLQKIFGDDVYQLRKEEIKIDQVSFYYYWSIYHFEISLNQEIADRLWIQQFLKEVIETKSVLEQNKYILITNAEKMTMQSQQMLRRMMETTTCKFIFTTENITKIITPIRSRCLCMRVPNPRIGDIYNILDRIITEEELVIPKELSKKKIIENIIQSSGKYRMGMPDVLLSIQILEMKFFQGVYQKTVVIEWIQLLQLLRKKIDEMIQEERMELMEEIREMTYDFWIHQISFDIIVRYLGGHYLSIVSIDGEYDEWKIQLVEIMNTYFIKITQIKDQYAFDNFLWEYCIWLLNFHKFLLTKNPDSRGIVSLAIGTIPTNNNSNTKK